MKTEVNPQEISRAKAFELWMSSPMPMVTLTKSFDVSRIVRLSRRHGIKFNALLCWCIARAASEQEVFFTLPEGGKLYRYDELAINVIVKNLVRTIKSAKKVIMKIYYLVKCFLYIQRDLVQVLRFGGPEARDLRP